MLRQRSFRITALVLSWAMTVTSAWASDPSLQAAPVRTEAEPTTPPQAEPRPGLQAAKPALAPIVKVANLPVRPVLECVVQNSPSSYTAHFGYTNDNAVPVTIAVGTNNKFTPTPINRGQPALFQPGRTPFYPNAAFQVPFNGSNLVWTLKGPDGTTRTSTASSGSKRCALDTTPPVLTLIEPKPDAVVKAPVALWLIYQDDRALALSSLSVKIDTRPVTGLTVDNDRATGTSGPLADGTHTLDAEIRDQAGNPARVKAVFTVDSTPPQLDVTEPLDGQVVTGTSVTVAGQVHDAHATTVVVETVPATVDCHGATGGTCSFRAENVPLGEGAQITLHVTAEDVANNVTTRTVRVNRDGTAPSVHIDVPTDGAVVRGPLVTVTGTASDDGGGPVQVEVNGQAATVSSGRFTAQVTAVDGALALEAVARDAANNTASDRVRVTVDSAPPVITVTEPVSRVVNDASVRVAGRVNDATAVTLTLDGQPLALSGDAFETMVTLGAEGRRVLHLRAEDAAGNAASADIELTIDRMSPVLEVTEPAEGAVLGALPIVVRGTVSDAVGPVVVQVNGVVAALAQGAFQVALEGLGEGEIALSVMATDAAGNPTAVTRTVRLDLSAPVLTLSTPTSGTLTQAGSIAAVGTVYDVGRATLTLNGAPIAVIWDDCCSGRFSTTAVLAEGDTTLTVEARDPLGRTVSASALVTRDSLAPLVELSAPERMVRGRSATAAASVTDAGSITRVVFLLDGQELASLTAPPYVATFTVPASTANGALLTLVARATDAAGNVGTASRSVRVSAGGVVVGQVLADGTGLPLAGAEVRLLVAGEVAAQAVSDERGRYSFAVEADEALVSVSNAGFTSVWRPVAVQPGVGTVAVDARVSALAAGVLADGSGTTLTAPLRVAMPSVAAAGALAAVALGIEGSARSTHDGNAQATLSTSAGAAVSADTLVARRLAKASAATASSPGVTVDVPGSATSAGAELRLTSLSAQGLPGLLPLGWSPVAAFELRASASLAGPLALRVHGLAGAGDVQLVVFEPVLQAWKLLAANVAVVDGGVETSLPGAGTFALVRIDDGALTADTPPVPLAVPAVGAVLPAAALAVVPTDATAAGAIAPAVLPPGGGTAMGSLALTSPVALPSGTLVQAEVRETYRLASGQTATEEPRLQDLLLYREPAPNGITLASTFPVTPARSFDSANLVSGSVRLEVRSGRESVRGTAGGSDAVEVNDGAARLSIPAGALPQNTAVSVAQRPAEAWFPPSAEVTALAQLEVDLAGATLAHAAELSVALSGLSATPAPSDTLLLARIERVQGVPHLQVIALAVVLDGRLLSQPYVGLPGVRVGGAYVFVRVSVPVGFIAGVTTAAGVPVRAVVAAGPLPFIGLANATGHYIVTAHTGAATVLASLPGTSLAATGTTNVNAGETAALDLALAGTATLATVRPPDGTLGVAPTLQVEIETSAALAPASITADAVQLVQLDGGGLPAGIVPVRLVLSATGRRLAVVPEHALAYSTSYRLQAQGLTDTQGGAVQVPTSNFRTKDFAPPQLDLTRLVISMPDANGLVHMSAPAGTFAPGTRVLILDAGNGVVVTFTADNDGALSGEFPATLDDRLFFTITDPLGNLTQFERSTYYDTATGFTSVGAGGGVISGPGGVELRVPEGALDRPVRLKLAAVPVADIADADKPADPYAVLGGASRIESSEPVAFAKEVDVAFPRPADAPNDPAAVYWIQRRVTTPGPGGSTLVVFETVDRAEVEGDKVVTASFPFRGYRDSLASVSALGGPLTGTLDLLFLSWQIPVAVTQPLPGAITGRVLRARWGSGTTPQYEPVSGAQVVGRDASGEAFFAGGEPFARTGTDGTYTLLDRNYEGGPITVTARADGQTVTAPGYQIGEAESLNISPLMRGFNVARVNVLLPAIEPPPPTPQIGVRLFRVVEGERVEITNGLVAADTPLVIGVTPVQVANQPALEVRGDGVKVQGQALSVIADPLRQARPSDPMAVTYVAQDSSRADGLYVPANAGTYVVEVTAIKATVPPEPVVVRYAFRVVAAGGGVETDPDHAPAVREAATVPRRAARGVPVSVLPQIAFTEPVRQVASSVVLEEVEGGTAVAVRVLGVGPAGPIAEVTDADVVTAITVQPLVGLRFGAEYRLRVGTGVTDLDPTPKTLAEAYETTFRTFTPEDIPNENAATAIAGLAVHGDRAYVAATRHPGGVGAPLSQQTGWLDVLDVTDPTEARRVGGPEEITKPPQDVAYADGLVAVTTFPQTVYELVDTGGTGAGTYSHEVRSSPANLYLYDVENDQPRWVGAVSLTQGLLDGVPQRSAMRGGRVYVASGRKGVQVVPVDDVRALFAAPPAPGEIASPAHRAMLRELGLQGTGYGSEAVITIPVRDSADEAVSLVDLKAAEIAYEGGSRVLVLATGQNNPVRAEVGLAVVDVGAGMVAKRVRVALGDDVLFSGSAIGYGEVNGKPLAVVGGLATGATGTGTRLFVVDLSPLSATPAGDPAVVGMLALPANERPTDVLVTSEGLAIVATATGKAVLVSLAQPTAPRRVGDVAGVGSRIGLTDANVLLSTARTFTAGSTDPLRGLHMATLGPIVPIVLLDPNYALVDADRRTTEDLRVRFRVVPAGAPLQSARVTVTDSEGHVLLAADVNMPASGWGELRLPRGQEIEPTPNTLSFQVSTPDGLDSDSFDGGTDYGAGPILRELSKRRVAQGAGAVGITLRGDFFVPSAQVGLATPVAPDVVTYLPAHFISVEELRATIPSAWTSAQADVLVSVRVQGLTSNPLTLRVIAPNQTTEILLSDIEPSSLSASDETTWVTLRGGPFSPDLNTYCDAFSSPLISDFIDASELRVLVPQGAVLGRERLRLWVRSRTEPDLESEVREIPVLASLRRPEDRAAPGDSAPQIKSTTPFQPPLAEHPGQPSKVTLRGERFQAGSVVKIKLDDGPPVSVTPLRRTDDELEIDIAPHWRERMLRVGLDVADTAGGAKSLVKEYGIFKPGLYLTQAYDQDQRVLSAIRPATLHEFNAAGGRYLVDSDAKAKAIDSAGNSTTFSLDAYSFRAWIRDPRPLDPARMKLTLVSEDAQGAVIDSVPKFDLAKQGTPRRGLSVGRVGFNYFASTLRLAGVVDKIDDGREDAIDRGPGGDDPLPTKFRFSANDGVSLDQTIEVRPGGRLKATFFDEEQQRVFTREHTVRVCPSSARHRVRIEMFKIQGLELDAAHLESAKKHAQEIWAQLCVDLEFSAQVQDVPFERTSVDEAVGIEAAGSYYFDVGSGSVVRCLPRVMTQPTAGSVCGLPEAQQKQFYRATRATLSQMEKELREQLPASGSLRLLFVSHWVDARGSETGTFGRAVSDGDYIENLVPYERDARSLSPELSGTILIRATPLAGIAFGGLTLAHEMAHILAGVSDGPAADAFHAYLASGPGLVKDEANILRSGSGRDAERWVRRKRFKQQQVVQVGSSRFLGLVTGTGAVQ